jgi:hypothetical protein
LTEETEAKGENFWKIMTLNLTGEEQEWEISFSLNSIRYPDNVIGDIS